jgi:trimethylamine--corrinoid protein Co-methyltransferase
MRLATLAVLSDGDVEQIHEASLDVLTQCGVEIGSSRALDFLASRGLSVDRERRVVRFSRTCIEDALAQIPQQFEVFDRQGTSVFILGDGLSKIAAGHNAVFWVDSETGATRRSTVADVECFARVCEELPAIDMIGIPVMPQDVPDPAATLLYGVRAVIENSRKPIFFSTDRVSVNNAIIQMLRAAFSGDLQTQVYGICQLSPTSPLYWEEGVLEAIWDTVPTGVPLAILPEPNAGISAPYTLAGLLTANNAECLSGLTMIQMLRPGTKVMYANSWTATDMRSAAALVGSTETTICRIAGAQLARRYRVPSHTTAPNSDNHAHDEQSAWEKTYSTFCAVGAGNDLIVNCGMFATGMTCSHEQLIMDEEISAMSRRIAEGIDVNDETIAKDLMIQVGPRGTGYLTADHTLNWLRSKEYLEPRVSVRGPRAAWEAAGGKDTYQLARDKVRATNPSPRWPLDAKRRAQLADIIGTFEP